MREPTRDPRTNLHRYTSLFAIVARIFLDSAYAAPPFESAAAFDPRVPGAPMATIFAYNAA